MSRNPSNWLGKNMINDDDDDDDDAYLPVCVEEVFKEKNAVVF